MCSAILICETLQPILKSVFSASCPHSSLSSCSYYFVHLSSLWKFRVTQFLYLPPKESKYCNKYKFNKYKITCSLGLYQTHIFQEEVTLLNNHSLIPFIWFCFTLPWRTFDISSCTFCIPLCLNAVEARFESTSIFEWSLTSPLLLYLRSDCTLKESGKLFPEEHQFHPDLPVC